LSMPMPAVSDARLHDDLAMLEAIIARPRGSGRRISEIKEELGTTMNADVAVYRDAEGLARALETVVRLGEEAASAYIDDRGTVFNQDVLGAVELGYMIDAARATVVGAIERAESRGAQFRTDHPERDDENWLKHIVISAGGDGEPAISYAPVTITDWPPEERKY
jgi:succinate dehydrogenase / fumarate reductase flavoprotein subunit